MLAPILASFLVMNCVLFLLKLIPFLNIILGLDVGFSDFLRLVSYLLPNIFIYTLPMAVMMGIIIGFSRMVADGEILALKSCGVGIKKMIPAVVMVAILVSITSAYTSIVLKPSSEIYMKIKLFQLAKDKIENGVKAEKFSKDLGNIVIYVDSVEDKKWNNVWISDMRNQQVPAITVAKSGEIDVDTEKMEATLTLKEGSINRPGDNNSQIITFDSYKLELPIKSGIDLNKAEAVRLNKKTMDLEQLRLAAAKSGFNSTQGKSFLIEYHKRLVLPVGCFILAMIALPIGLSNRRNKKNIANIYGLSIFILYYILYTIGKMLAEDSFLPVGIPMWMPNIIFTLIAIKMYRLKGLGDQE